MEFLGITENHAQQLKNVGQLVFFGASKGRHWSKIELIHTPQSSTIKIKV